MADQVSTDQASFLPSRYESVRAQELGERAFGVGDGASATVVVKRAAVTGQQGISPNKQLQLVNVALTGSPAGPALGDTVVSIRDKTRSVLHGSGLSYAVTGNVAFTVDNQDAFDTALLVVRVVTLALVVGLLLVIYRSPGRGVAAGRGRRRSVGRVQRGDRVAHRHQGVLAVEVLVAHRRTGCSSGSTGSPAVARETCRWCAATARSRSGVGGTSARSRRRVSLPRCRYILEPLSRGRASSYSVAVVGLGAAAGIGGSRRSARVASTASGTPAARTAVACTRAIVASVAACAWLL